MSSLAIHAEDTAAQNETGSPAEELAIDDIEKSESPNDLLSGVPKVITFGPLINTGVLKLVDLLKPCAI
jgi:hypothetical protein